MNILPEIYINQIIKKFALETLEPSSNIYLLSNSEKFQKQITKLFKKFSTLSLSPTVFQEIIETSKIEDTDKKRLIEISNIYKKFMNFIAENDFSIPKHAFYTRKIDNLKDFVLNLKSKVKSIKYLEFNDFQDEAIQISERIKEQTAKNDDIALFAFNQKVQKEFLNVFDTLNVKTNYTLEDEKTRNFRIKTEQIFNFFELTKEAEEQKKLLIENLFYEKEFLDELIALYKENQENLIIEKLLEKEKIDEKDKFNKLFAYINFSKNILNLKPEKEIILGLLDNIYYQENTNPEQKVEIIFQNTNKKYEYLYLPNFVESVFSKSTQTLFISESADKTITQKIKEKHEIFDGILEPEEEIVDFIQIENIFNSAENIILSSSNYENSKKINPHIIFELFKTFDFENYEKIESNKKEEKIERKKTEVNKINKKIFGEIDELKLSASAIKNFQDCPRKFFFKNILNLKEESNFQASYGTCAHALLEVLAKKHSKNYTLSKINELIEILFNTKNDEENSKNAGFSDTTIALIKNTDELSLMQMKERAISAFAELQETGFFEEIPDEFYPEQDFEFSLPQIPNVSFKGRIDLIAKYGDKYKIVDYKTGKTPNKPQAFWTNLLTLEFKKYNRSKEIVEDDNLKKEYNYQLPIYYFAIQNAEKLSKFKNNVSEYYLQFVRSKEDGACPKDSVEAFLYDSVADKIIENLDKTIISNIKKTEQFEYKQDYFCENCAYNFLCDKDEEAE